ncbi:hypothetical protein ERS044074_02347, partial [Streptococcus pneumoniae]
MDPGFFQVNLQPLSVFLQPFQSRPEVLLIPLVILLLVPLLVLETLVSRFAVSLLEGFLPQVFLSEVSPRLVFPFDWYQLDHFCFFEH